MRHVLLPLALVAAPLAHAAEPKAPDTNVVFRGATIYDGTGGKPFTGDVHVKGEKIAAVGKVGKVDGATEVNAEGLVICPGFIDLHTHCDSGLTGKTGRLNKNYVTQGCTTVVTGNCGSGPVDAAAFFKALEDGGVGTNVIHLAPHNSIRDKVMGNANRAPTADELKKMEELVDQAMKDGAWGLSTGLIYNPGTYAKTDEIVALAKVAAKHGGLYASHIRNESAGLLDAIDEALTVGRKSGCRVHISHIKASGKAAWGSSAQAAALIEDARKKGWAVTADQYPYVASSTSLRATLVPAKYREGTNKEFVARLDDPTTGPKLKADVEKALEGRDGGKRIQIARYAPNPKWQGKTITAIAEAENKEPIDIVLGDRAQRRRAGGELRHARGRRARVHEAAVGRDRQRRRGADTRRDRAAPAQLRHLPAEDRLLRGRGEARTCRARGPQFVRPARGHPQADGPRVPQARPLRGRGRVRPEDLPRHRHLR